MGSETPGVSASPHCPSLAFLPLGEEALTEFPVRQVTATEVSVAVSNKTHQVCATPQELGFNHPIVGWQATICRLSEKSILKARFYMFIRMCSLFSGGAGRVRAVN